MSAKRILPFPLPRPKNAARLGEDREPTEADYAYVRAQARAAARACFDEEQRQLRAAAPDETTCA